MKTILTDIDGVCLNWSKSFDKYLKYYHPGLTIEDPTEYDAYRDVESIMKAHNHSAWMGYLEPLRDAKDILITLKQEGWEVHACTAMGFDPHAIALRKTNLDAHFPGVFDRMDTVGFGESKEKWLEKYRGTDCIWVEDKISNAMLGAQMGIKTFLMKQSYNGQCDDKQVVKVDNWQQIYYYINKQ